VITLTLLHPLQAVPVQSWTFDPNSVIRIGRSTDNEVILYSAVVSRHHVEIRRRNSQWEIVNLGANGTYLDGKRINKAPVIDGMIVRLASSGPQIQIRLDSSEEDDGLKTPRGSQVSTTLDSDLSKDTLITEE
jgi:pSer/pThr/pTyr-binding forkhead associated (FHA) protein